MLLGYFDAEMNEQSPKVKTDDEKLAELNARDEKLHGRRGYSLADELRGNGIAIAVGIGNALREQTVKKP